MSLIRELEGFVAPVYMHITRDFDDVVFKYITVSGGIGGKTGEQPVQEQQWGVWVLSVLRCSAQS